MEVCARTGDAIKAVAAVIIAKSVTFFIVLLLLMVKLTSFNIALGAGFRSSHAQTFTLA